MSENYDIDLILVKNAKKVEIKNFKTHDKVKLFMPKSWKGAHEIIWRLRCKVVDMPLHYHPLRDAILAKAIEIP